MKPNQRFVGQDKAFWAHVRSISQELGYTDRKTRQIKVPTHQELAESLVRLSLSSAHVQDKDGTPSAFGETLHAYFAYRAGLLNREVHPLLMNAAQAEELFNAVKKETNSTIAMTMNKQKGAKKKPAFLRACLRTLDC